jgi:hypothetical protein
MVKMVQTSSAVRCPTGGEIRLILFSETEMWNCVGDGWIGVRGYLQSSPGALAFVILLRMIRPGKNYAQYSSGSADDEKFS